MQDRDQQAVTIIGIDCATNPRNVGLARGIVTAEGLRIEEPNHRDGPVQLTSREAILEVVSGWIGDRTLFALDAPLGWPEGLSGALINHMAGNALIEEPNKMFRRRTDDIVHEKLRKRPLDIGADRIARTSHSALKFLRGLSEDEKVKKAIPMAWNPGEWSENLGVIEVYPAGTLAAFPNLKNSGYKGSKADAATNRRILVKDLLKELKEEEVKVNQVCVQPMEESDHVLDAVLCVVAGFDFLKGNVIPLKEATDLRFAQKEGWIWVRPLQASS